MKRSIKNLSKSTAVLSIQAKQKVKGGDDGIWFPIIGRTEEEAAGGIWFPIAG